MKTDDLINMLAQNVEPMERPRWARRMAMTLVLGLIAAGLLVLAVFGMRPNIGTSMSWVLIKAAFSALAAAVMLPLVMRLMRPGRPLGWRVGAALVFVAICALVTFIALMGQPTEARMHAWTGGFFPWCIIFIPLLAAPTAAGLVWVMRGLAPTRLTLSGAAIGALSGGVGAMAYAMYCPVDSVAFVTTWYVVGIAISAAAGALIGSKVLRW
ncbi:MAG TPA: DUF1109 domain-containing protein [Vitreimonas sp.]|jgi:hypothetical protein|nr:DUF1109 domain-containing protein [Vitreimonas sp.]